MPEKTLKRNPDSSPSGRLRIGDHWNAITIIALSQTNPLKAIAEFIENSIDAQARTITLIRGKSTGQTYLKITDDGNGIQKTEEGIPDFKYVATHICDSIKRELKVRGATGIQGEFGIGLLSFWTLGKELVLTSSGTDGRNYRMRLIKGKPGYTINRVRTLLPLEGTELVVAPLLPGIRSINGEKIQRYLSSELRDRIRKSGVRIRILDKTARAEYSVEPRQFSGRLLHNLPIPARESGEVYCEIYLTKCQPGNRIGLYRSGTRVLENISSLDQFNCEPWTSGYLEGIIDVAFLNLTPGTRDGIILDDRYTSFCDSIIMMEKELLRLINEQKKAEEQRVSQKLLHTVQKAFREALLSLPPEEYDWFNIGKTVRKPLSTGDPARANGEGTEAPENAGKPMPLVLSSEPLKKQFFEHPGPLFSVRISPSSCSVGVGKQRNFAAICRDQKRLTIEQGLLFKWEIIEGDGRLSDSNRECTTFFAPGQPCLTGLRVTATRNGISCQGEALVTVTDSLVLESKSSGSKPGFPGYTFQKAPGELWRSKYVEEKNVIVINNGHRDFVFASQNRTRRLRYIFKLFAKELVLKNFRGIPADKLLERMTELMLYAEENLR